MRSAKSDMLAGRLILARHAQSELDAEDRLSGRNDPPLSAHGLREANALAFTLGLSRDHVLDYVVASRLTAARHTAEIVMRKVGYEHAIESDDALDERDYGELSGLTQEAARKTVGEATFDRLVHGAYSLNEPLAMNTIVAFKTRVEPRLRKGASILLVSYDDNLRVLAAHLDREPIARDPWRTGMALDYRFDESLNVYAKDTLQAVKWA